MTRDTWSGIDTLPMSFNRWNYVNGNPINYIDPSGHSPIKCIGCGPDVTDWYEEELRIWRNDALDTLLLFNQCEESPQGQFIGKVTAILLHGGEFPYKVIDFNYADEPNRAGGWPNPTVNDAGDGLPYHGQKYADILDGNFSQQQPPFSIQGGKSAQDAAELTWRVPGGGSVTLCGTCIERSELGNFMLGYYAGSLGLHEGVALHGGLVIGGFTREWDEAAYHLAYKYAVDQTNSSYLNPFASSTSLCTFLQGQGINQMVDPFVQGYTPSTKALHSGFGHYTSHKHWDTSWGAVRRAVNNVNASPGTVGPGVIDNNPRWSHSDRDKNNLMITRDLRCRYDPTNC